MEKKLIELLNKSLADEWLSYYCFWISARVMVGPMRDEIAKEMDEMGAEELRHAGILVEKIIRLGGMPVLAPKDWHKIANCKYEEPSDYSIKAILFHSIKREQRTVEGYKKLISFTQGKTCLEHEVMANILEEEIEQKDHLINILEHLDAKEAATKHMKRKMGKWKT